jgi:hypothetical protein
MSVYDELASILYKAQGRITEDGGTIDVGREVVMLRSAYEEQVARIAELEAVAEAGEIDIRRKNGKGWVSAEEAGVWKALRAAGYLGGGE